MMLLNANALRIPLADCVVQTCVTSPPYFGLRDYGVPGQLGLEETPDCFIERMVEVGREVWRVLRDDGTFWLNIGDSYSNSGRGEGGKGIHSKKQTTNRGAYFDNNQLDKRAETDCGIPAKNLMMIPARVALALQADGWYLRAEIIWAKPNPMPESVTDRPTRSHEMIYLLTKQARYFYDAAAVKEPAVVGWNDAGFRNGGEGLYIHDGAYHNHKPVKKTGGNFSKKYAEAQPNHGAMTLERPADNGTRNQRDVWNIATQGYPGAHYATFPTDIPQRCILAGSKSSDLVLDPFCGSGTTGEVALKLGRRFVGLDLSMKYLMENAAPRLAGVPIAMDLAL